MRANINLGPKLFVMVAGVALLSGCASEHRAGVARPGEAPAAAAQGQGLGYDDRQIAKIQRGDTGEAQLLEWFGVPESRSLNPDGRASLSWGFSRRTDGGPGNSGKLRVTLAPDGKVEAYSASGGPLGPGRNAESGYDDRRVAQIRRGETSAAELLEWFGPAYSRKMQPDGRAQLAWTFNSRVDGGPGHSGELSAALAPDGKVEAYSARQARR